MIRGGLKATGLRVRDTLCTLDNLVCSSDVEFIAITAGANGDPTTMLQFPNIFGLAPNDEYSFQSAPNYVQTLVNRNLITSAKATLFLNVNSTLMNCTTCSIMSFGSDRRDEGLYVADNEWYHHPWEFKTDQEMN